MAKFGLVLVTIFLCLGWLCSWCLSGAQRTTPSIAAVDVAVQPVPSVKDADQYFKEAQALHLQNRCKEAIPLYSECLKLSPHFGVAYINRADANFRLGHYKLAYADANEAVALGPNEFGGYCNRGEAELYLGKTKAAVADLDKAVEIAIARSKKTGEPFYYRSKALELLGQKQKSKEDLKESQMRGFDPRRITDTYY